MLMQQQTYKADFQSKSKIIFNVGCNANYQIPKTQQTKNYNSGLSHAHPMY